jgi:hypothetical protein
MAATLSWYVGNTMRLSFDLTDGEGGAVSGATVTGTLRPRITGGVDLWSGALEESETAGTYEAAVDAEVVAGRGYFLDVEAEYLGKSYKNTETVTAAARSDAA